MLIYILFGRTVHLPLKNFVTNLLKTPDNVTHKGSQAVFSDCLELECYDDIMEQAKAKHD